MTLISFISIPTYKNNQLVYTKINLNTNEISIKDNNTLEKPIININKYVNDINQLNSNNFDNKSEIESSSDDYDINAEIMDMLTKELSISKNPEDILEIENTLKTIKAKNKC